MTQKKSLPASADFLASVVVFLVALPLCMGIAIASGVPPAAGILTGIIAGIVTGSLAGCPMQVSGPAAGLTVIVWGLVAQYGLVGLGVIVFLAGLIQVAAALLRLGRLFQAVSPAVIHGMLAGIGVLILASQFHVMLDDRPKGSGLQNLLSIPGAAYDTLFAGADGAQLAAITGVITIAVLVLWNQFGGRTKKVLPAPLLAVAAGAIVAGVFGFTVRFVDVPSNLLGAVTPVSIDALSLLLNGSIWLAATAVAFVASAETLLCAAAVDTISKTRSRYDKELMAQGVGNALCGLVGALPMTGVIVRSTANMDAGAKTRWSAILHGFWLILVVVALPGVLRMIPISALAALLVYTGYKLVNPAEVRKLASYGRAEVVTYFVTLTAIVCTDLLHGVLIGVAVSAVRLLATFARIDTRLLMRGRRRFDLLLEGTACFITLPRLADVLDELPDGSRLHVHFEHLHYVDHACVELLEAWEKRQEAFGGELVVEWHELERRYRSGTQRLKAV